MGFKHKVAIITGAASGVGKEIAARIGGESAGRPVAVVNRAGTRVAFDDVVRPDRRAFVVGMRVADQPQFLAARRANAAAIQLLELEERLVRLRVLYALQRTEGDLAGKFQTLASIANVHAKRRFAAAGYQVDAPTMAALQRAAALRKSFGDFTARRRAAAATG